MVWDGQRRSPRSFDKLAFYKNQAKGELARHSYTVQPLYRLGRKQRRYASLLPASSLAQSRYNHPHAPRRRCLAQLVGISRLRQLSYPYPRHTGLLCPIIHARPSQKPAAAAGTGCTRGDLTPAQWPRTCWTFRRRDDTKTSRRWRIPSRKCVWDQFGRLSPGLRASDERRQYRLCCL